MTIQLTQVNVNNVFKDDMYVEIYSDAEIEELLFLKFFNNINSITVELMQSVKKEVVRKILLMEHISKIVYRNSNGVKEEVSQNRKIIIKMHEKEDPNIISDDTIIKFQQILDISNNLVVVQNVHLLSNELLNILQRNDAEYVRIVDYGKRDYPIYQIRNVIDKVQEYIDLTKNKSNETEKFIELYTSLYKNVSLDKLNSSHGDICDIVYNKTTEEGYAEILGYILDEMKFENRKITGKLANGNIHYWNQVKLDYIWYNVDLSLDVETFTRDGMPIYCLKSDKSFYEDHVALSQNIEICNQDSKYFLVKGIEEKEGFIIRLFKRIGQFIGRKKVKRLTSSSDK